MAILHAHTTITAAHVLSTPSWPHRAIHLMHDCGPLPATQLLYWTHTLIVSPVSSVGTDHIDSHSSNVGLRLLQAPGVSAHLVQAHVGTDYTDSHSSNDRLGLLQPRVTWWGNGVSMPVLSAHLVQTRTQSAGARGTLPPVPTVGGSHCHVSAGYTI